MPSYDNTPSFAASWKALVNATLDPYSLRQHRRLRDVLRQVRDYDVPVEREAFQVRRASCPVLVVRLYLLTTLSSSRHSHSK